MEIQKGYYACIFNERIDIYGDTEERRVIGGAYIGTFTDEQKSIFVERLTNLRKYSYINCCLFRHDNESENPAMALLLADGQKLGEDCKSALSEVIDMANDVRAAFGSQDKNVSNPFVASPVGSTESDTDEFATWGEKVIGILGNASVPLAERLQNLTANVFSNTAKSATPPIESAHADSFYQTRAASGDHAPGIIFHGDETEEIGDTTGRPLHTSESPDSPLIKAIESLPGKIGTELQDAWAKFYDPPDDTELDYAGRLRRTTKNTYEQIAALVGERFPDGKFQAGDGEKLRKALNPPKTTQ